MKLTRTSELAKVSNRFVKDFLDDNMLAIGSKCEHVYYGRASVEVSVFDVADLNDLYEVAVDIVGEHEADRLVTQYRGMEPEDISDEAKKFTVCFIGNKSISDAFLSTDPDELFGLMFVHEGPCHKLDHEFIATREFSTSVFFTLLKEDPKYENMFNWYSDCVPKSDVGKTIVNSIARDAIYGMPKAKVGRCVATDLVDDSIISHVSAVGTVTDVCGSFYTGAHALDEGMSLNMIKASYNLWHICADEFIKLSIQDRRGIAPFIVKEWEKLGIDFNNLKSLTAVDIEALYKDMREVMDTGLKEVPVNHEDVINKY